MRVPGGCGYPCTAPPCAVQWPTRTYGPQARQKVLKSFEESKAGLRQARGRLAEAVASVEAKRRHIVLEARATPPGRCLPGRCLPGRLCPPGRHSWPHHGERPGPRQQQGLTLGCSSDLSSLVTG